MTFFNIVPAVFSYFFKDVTVLPAVLFTFAYRIPEVVSNEVVSNEVVFGNERLT